MVLRLLFYNDKSPLKRVYMSFFAIHNIYVSPMSSPDPSNPLFATWSTPHEAPPFDQIKPEHFMPAFEHGLAAHRAEIAAIEEATEPPSFDNTVLAMERGGLFLDRVSAIFYNLVSADGDD